MFESGKRGLMNAVLMEGRYAKDMIWCSVLLISRLEGPGRL